MARGFKEPPSTSARLSEIARRDVRKKANELEDMAGALRNQLSPSAESRNTVDFLERVVEQMRRAAAEWKGGVL